MDEQTKQTKSDKKELPKPFQKLIDSGLPVKRAEFINQVSCSTGKTGMPEAFFDLESERPTRKDVRMWWTVAGLLCEHNDEFFCVPQDNIRVVRFA